MSLKLIAGLGNPGERYRDTRHNAGFMVVDLLAREAGIAWEKKRRLKAWLGIGRWKERDLILVKPATFVNLSGEAIRKVMDYYRVSPAEILVVVDDVNLSPGRIRLRRAGGSGGHHGLESIALALGGDGYLRLRVGVGGGERKELADYVLSAAEEEESRLFRQALDNAVATVGTMIEEGLEAAMNRHNPTAPESGSNQKEEN